jgi:hypothetical protein
MPPVRSALVVDGFAEEGRALRAAFDERMADPRSARADRFVWDFWHVPGQYTVLRTPAWTYFPRRVYEAFHRRLVWWGRRTLGCHDVSPPWLSCYVEGCRQELHGDLPHGPFAFVYSLTPWSRRRFRGGETLLVREEMLDWWADFRSTRRVEEPDLLRAIPARFDRLVVFDPRIPHGVRRVEGTLDPREGRLVVHGWFLQPRPFVEGPLPARALADRLPAVTEALTPHLASGLLVTGVLSLGLAIGADGVVQRVRILADTTRVRADLEPARRALGRAAVRAARALRFPRRSGPSRITLPLVFEA